MVMWGLLLDAVGFVLVFMFGGFNIGSPGKLLIEDNPYEMAKWKLLGMIMVVSGFALQFHVKWLA